MQVCDVLTFGEPLVNFVARETGSLHHVSEFWRGIGGGLAGLKRMWSSAWRLKNKRGGCAHEFAESAADITMGEAHPNRLYHL
ncbi:hypothetical protein NZD89_23120 [Alicyclobacillus fastidiosus]|uniref:Uncharacterized protein n=1 Tax=Alicyclobacillus fastidiosus TaxID=392011 RepID=A0ABY6ZE57_9BACL|nr:hypothetical protein [Alicyclobacillus fastidiosus]WAH41127.1 hypothetical protein NZD89_23120 [Alicyclobacillus fastidiosus]GMA62688.1 hypothetical protein GCM10025859_31280 [Alicyclobacillus fastidiosus]